MTSSNNSLSRRVGVELAITDGPLRGLNARATPGQTLRVGRSQNCDLRVIDPRLSRQHFAVMFAEARWWIDDLSSSNGTLLNDSRISDPTELNSGDIVRAGDTCFHITFDECGPHATDSVSSSHLHKIIFRTDRSTANSTVTD